MPAKAAPKKAPAKPKTNGRTTRGSEALNGLEVSLEQAQKALVELRRDLSTGGRRLVKDVEAAVRNARRDLRGTRRAITADLTDLGSAIKPSRPVRKPVAKAAPKPAAKAAAKPAPKTARKPAARAKPRARAK